MHKFQCYQHLDNQKCLFDNQIQIMHAEEYQRPDFNQMLSTVWDLFRRFGKINKIYIDGSNPSFISVIAHTLKMEKYN